MGSSLSNDSGSPKFSNRRQENQQANNTQGDSCSMKESNSVYYNKTKDPKSNRKLDESEIEDLPDAKILEMTVCKMNRAGHWFIAVYSGNKPQKPLELHYCKIGSVKIYPSNKNLAELRCSRYFPVQVTTLKQVIRECFRFVKKGSYGLLSNSCQDFVTEIMTKFTNRQVGSLAKISRISVVCSNSVSSETKKVVTVLEKKFLDKCESRGVFKGIYFLKDEYAYLKDILDKDISFEGRYTIEKQTFMHQMFCPLNLQNNKEYLPRFFKFMSSQEKEVAQEIHKLILKAYRLATFLVITEPKIWIDESNWMSPEQALNEYNYNF